MNLIERVKAILLKPDAEWPVIERESGDPTYLFKNYVAILALIPAVAGFISASIVGVDTPAGTVRLSIFAGLFSAIVGYVLTFAIVYVAALIVDALAPTFGGQKNFGSALKLAVYSYTPAWLASVFLVVPLLKFLVILGLYGVYLLYLGLPVLMRAPKEKAFLYAVAIFACSFVVALILGMIQTLFWI